MHIAALLTIPLLLLASCASNTGYPEDNIPVNAQNALEITPTPDTAPVPQTQEQPGPLVQPQSQAPSPANNSAPFASAQPHLSYNSTSYLNDPTHPYNRGQWIDVTQPNGSVIKVWSSGIDLLAPDLAHRQSLPPTSGYTTEPDRWNAQLRH